MQIWYCTNKMTFYLHNLFIVCRFLRQFLFILELLEQKCILNGNMCLSGTKTKMSW